MAALGGVGVLIRSAANVCRVQSRNFKYSAAILNSLCISNSWRRVHLPTIATISSIRVTKTVSDGGYTVILVILTVYNFTIPGFTAGDSVHIYI